MKSLVLGVAAAAALVAFSSAAMAADAPMMVDNAAIDMATAKWDGFYVGIGGAFLSSTTIVETIGAIQGSVGVNKSFDKFLLGAEAYLAGNVSSLGTPVYFSLGAEGRAGFWASDAVLVYGALGGEYVQGGNTYATVGGGIEFAATDKLSIDAEYKYYIGTNNGWQGHSVSLSANWHF